MKRYFANLFYIVPASDVVSIDGNTITLDTGKSIDTILTGNDVEFNENLKESGANDYYEQKTTPISHSVESTIRTKYRKEKVIVQLKTTQGEVFTWGTKEVPVRLTLDSGLNADTWQMKRSATSPLIQ
ncbi:hypothetical protein [Plebeiibacterium sediminum]|uniref:Uncharacterized protein n=1 Tax=Plebeiibacterium sediminum TaxID=2992112 RepID=A0AAE3M1A9_9BACT|nr:hypothetical protein [Plebeiobacterium sediminum]MCW3784915.1 hypothetical protein [Plebeiobacterium sediminum]